MAKHTTKAQIIAPTYVQLLLVYIIPLLVGGWALPLWKMMDCVSWDDDIPNWMEKSNSCSKPPTSFQNY
jgi:hypothetical protein